MTCVIPNALYVAFKGICTLYPSPSFGTSGLPTRAESLSQHSQGGNCPRTENLTSRSTIRIIKSDAYLHIELEDPKLSMAVSILDPTVQRVNHGQLESSASIDGI